jgi:triphosphoribosyl-dephospho-CoA synthase
MMEISTTATLACIWEATAAKPGNVYRGADFEDVTYADFLTSAAVIGPTLALARNQGVGYAVLDSIRAIHSAVGTNTYLGTVLLLAPLAAVPADVTLREGLPQVLVNLTSRDTAHVYEAIRLAQPGGLGKVDEGDIHASAPDIKLVEAMQLAADRDLVARQFTNNFEQVFWVADRIATHGSPLADAIVRAYLELLAEYPDTLVARKCGSEMSEEISGYAKRILTYDEEEFAAALADFDFWLRADGHRRNPGTSADLIAAGLFVLLRQKRLEWPLKFYG